MLEIQDHPNFKKRFSNKVPFKFAKASGYRVYNIKPQKGRGTTSPTKKRTCRRSGKKHYGYCQKGRDNFFGCGKSGNNV